MQSSLAYEKYHNTNYSHMLLYVQFPIICKKENNPNTTRITSISENIEKININKTDAILSNSQDTIPQISLTYILKRKILKITVTTRFGDSIKITRSDVYTETTHTYARSSTGGICMIHSHNNLLTCHRIPASAFCGTVQDCGTFSENWFPSKRSSSQLDPKLAQTNPGTALR